MLSRTYLGKENLTFMFEKIVFWKESTKDLDFDGTIGKECEGGLQDKIY